MTKPSPSAAAAAAGERQAAASPPRTLFQEAWWLSVASEDAVEHVEVAWDGRVVGSLSFMRRKRLGRTTLGMPLYTRTLGPVLTPPPSNPATFAQNARRILKELVDKLPPHDRFYQLLDPDSATAFGLSLAGCVVASEFTFRAGCGPPAALFENATAETRRLIRSRGRSLTTMAHHDIDRFLRLARTEHAPQANRHVEPLILRLHEATAQRGQSAILTACGPDGLDAASVILVWDARVLYYWLPTRNRRQPDGGANAFLIWKALEFALDRGLVFDFDGYNSIAAARLLSSFGVPPCIRSSVTHRSLLGMAADLARTAFIRKTVSIDARGATSRYCPIYRPDRLE